MVKIIAVVISALVGILCAFVFHNHTNNYFLDVLVGVSFFIATFILIVVLFFAWLFFNICSEDKKIENVVQKKHYRKILYLMDLLLFSLFGIKAHVRGTEQLSVSEQYIIVCNHRSNIDSLVIDKYLRYMPLTFVTKDSLFKVPFVGRVIHGCAYLKIVRGDANQEFDTFVRANDMLTRQDKPLSVGIFPEGTRNKSGDVTSLLDFKPGSFRLAYKSKKPIVVMALRGTKEVNNNLLLKRHHVYLDVLEIIDFDQYKDMDVNQLALYCQNKVKTFLLEAK